MKRKVLAAMLSMAMVATLAMGCGGGSGADAGTSDSGSDSSASESIVVGFSQVGAESDWRTANSESMKSTFSEENGYELKIGRAHV